jgi:hypothetical protein
VSLIDPSWPDLVWPNIGLLAAEILFLVLLFSLQRFHARWTEIKVLKKTPSMAEEDEEAARVDSNASGVAAGGAHGAMPIESVDNPTSARSNDSSAFGEATSAIANATNVLKTEAKLQAHIAAVTAKGLASSLMSDLRQMTFGNRHHRHSLLIAPLTWAINRL